MVLDKTPYAEEISKVSSFIIDVTTRCNMNCSFCYNYGRADPTQKDMTFVEFKQLIDQIEEYTRKTKVKIPVCITGGEPMLNKDIVKMVKYATKKLGRKRTVLTTNLALFPTNSIQMIEILKKMGLPKINVSLDREHLKYGVEMEGRIEAFFKAVKELPIRFNVINVAQTKYEEKHRWPKNIVKLIPKEVKLMIKNDNVGGVARRDGLSIKGLSNEYKQYLVELKKGNFKSTFPPHSVVRGTGLSPNRAFNYFISIGFGQNGKTYLHSSGPPIAPPQFSLGNWKRESLTQIIQTNAPFKMNMLKSWFGMRRVKSGHKYPSMPFLEASPVAKTKLFGKYALRKLNEAKQIRKRLRAK